MIAQEFTIKSIKDSKFELDADKNNGCDSCSAKKGCGIGVLAKYFKKPIFVDIGQKNQDKKIGDSIILEINEAQLLKNAFMVYLMPLLLMFFVGIVARWLLPNNEFLWTLFAMSALIFSFIYLRYFYK
jgi:sigma-E factor negative regulatory protein RseC